jgi:hypothetical protein
MAETSNRLLVTLDRTWEETLMFVRNNPGHGWAYVAFLAEMIKSGMAKPLSDTRVRLLQLVRAAPVELGLCHGLLDPKLWEERWQTFLDEVWRFAGGGDSDAVASRTGAVDLLRRWLAHSPGGSVVLPPELGYLFDVTLMAVIDDSPVVANHAAYNVVGLAARTLSPVETSHIVGALRRMASDPRLGVRGAAAYAGTKLPQMNVSNAIRGVAVEIEKSLCDDDYAVVQRQRKFGALDGAHPL